MVMNVDICASQFYINVRVVALNISIVSIATKFREKAL